MKKTSFPLPGLLHFLRTALPFLFPVLAYGLILVIPIPQAIGATIRHAFNLWLVGAGIFLYLGFRLDHSQSGWLSFTPAALLFGLSLGGLWTNAFSEMQVVSGMLYFSDASQYSFDTLRLLNGLPFSSFSARHPLPTLFTALLLWITGKNLQLTLAILVFICALCVYLAGREISRTFGPLPAAIFILSLFLFYRRFTGILDSENLGLALGCLSFTFFLHATRHRQPASLVGMLLLSLALAARPGAFLILPAVLVWFILGSQGAPYSRLKRAALGGLILSSGFTLTYITNAWLAEPGSRMYSNLAYTVYGIAQGGKGWEQFLKDFPEYAQQPTVIAEQFAYQQAARLFSEHPQATLQGLLRSFTGYFSLEDQSLFGFLCGGEITAFNQTATPAKQLLYRGVRLVFLFLSAVGLWKERKKAANFLALAILSGWFLTLPLVPAEDAGMMRVFAASMPYLILLPASGLASVSRGLSILPKRIIRRANFRSPEPGSADDRNQSPQSEAGTSLLNDLCAFALIMLLFSGPLLFRILRANHQPVIYHPSCQPGKIFYAIEINQGSFITLVEEGIETKSHFPEIQYTDYLKSISQFHRPESIEPLAGLPSGILLANTINLTDGFPFWVVLPRSAQNLVNHRLEICGHWDAGFDKIGLGFLIVDQVKMMK